MGTVGPANRQNAESDDDGVNVRDYLYWDSPFDFWLQAAVDCVNQQDDN
jgi:hypothetical protein